MQTGARLADLADVWFQIQGFAGIHSLMGEVRNWTSSIDPTEEIAKLNLLAEISGSHGSKTGVVPRDNEGDSADDCRGECRRADEAGQGALCLGGGGTRRLGVCKRGHDDFPKV
jgi:hypothetical protein